MASLNIPYSFANNTVANANQVNDNFLAVKNFVESSVVQSDGSVQITTAGIVDSAVTTAKIAASAVTEAKLADSSVTSAKIVDGTIVNADINASAAIALSKLGTTGTITATTFVGALTGNASGSSGSCTGNAATATNLVGLRKGSNVVYMSSGSCSFEHGFTSTPSTAVISNGDTSQVAAAFEIVSMDSDDINIRAIGSSYTGNVRINWIAFA
jgi:hypothetical protein